MEKEREEEREEVVEVVSRNLIRLLSKIVGIYAGKVTVEEREEHGVAEISSFPFIERRHLRLSLPLSTRSTVLNFNLSFDP